MSDPGQKGVVATMDLAYNSWQTGRRLFESSVNVMSIVRQASGNRRRWRAVVGGLLVAVMMACPLLCRAGTCCSGHPGAATAGSSESLDEDACPHCRQSEEPKQSQVPPLSPRNPVHQGRCLCSGATAPVVVSAPQLQVETSRHFAVEGSGSGCCLVPAVREACVGAEKGLPSGRSLCVAHGVLIC